MKTVAFIFGFMFIILSGHAQKSEFRIEVSNDTVLEGNYGPAASSCTLVVNCIMYLDLASNILHLLRNPIY